MKKRLTSLLLTAAMIISMVVVPTAAAGTLGLTVDASDGMPGETVNVNVDISGLGETQLGTLQVAVAYDIDSLELVGAPVAGSAVPAGAMVTGGDANKTGTVNVSVITMSGAIATDGTVASMSFKIKDSVSDAELPLSASIVVAKTPISAGMTDVKSEFTVTNDVIGVIYPVTVTTGDAKQETVTSATLNGSYVENVQGLTIEASGIKWGTSENALTETAEFGTEVTGTQGATIFYQAFVKIDGVEYVGEPKFIVLKPAEADYIEISGNIEIDVTFEGNSTTFAADVFDQFGQPFDTAVVAWSLVEPAAGVSIDAATGVLSVDKTAQSGTVTVKATSGNASATKDITIKRPAPIVDAITIADVAPVSVPTAAVGTTTVELTATGVDQFQETITLDNVQWSISAAEGVSIDDNVITVTNKAKAGTITVTADVNGVTDTFELTINKDTSVPTTISFVDGTSATISIPTSETPNTREFAVVVVDQFGDEMTTDVTFAMAGDAKVSAENNKITVQQGATKDSVYTLTATAGDATASIQIKVVDIDITWGTFTENANAVYGMTWGQIVTVAPGTAKLEGQDVSGTWTVANADVIPNAGEQTYIVQFTSTNGDYVVTTTETATIAQKEVTPLWEGAADRVYDGEPSDVMAFAAGINDTTVDMVTEGGKAVDAGTHTAKAILNDSNYVLKAGTETKTYTITKAEIPTFEGSAPKQISFKKTSNIDNVIALIVDEVKAYGFNDEELTGTITIERDLSDFPAGSVLNVETVFTPDSTNYLPKTFTFELEITEGDPQTVVIADSFYETDFVYGDASFDLKQYITVSRGDSVVTAPEFTFESNDENIATVDANGKVTIVAADMVTINFTVAGDDDWATYSGNLTLVIEPKTLTIDPASLGAIEMVYNGSNFIDNAEQIAAIMANAKLDGIVPGDEVNLTLEHAYIGFYDAEGEPATNVGEWDTALEIPGVDNANYQLSDDLVGPKGKITKAPSANVTVTLYNPTQIPGDNVEPVIPVITPSVTDGTVKVSYWVMTAPAVEAKAEVPCGHTDDKTNCTIPEGDCDHTDNCGYAPAVEAKEAVYEWVSEVPKTAGTYPVKVELTGDTNIEDTTVTEGLTLTLSVPSSGGGGSSTSSVTVSKSENGSVSLSTKRAAAGKEVTINVKPNEGYMLKDIIVTDEDGNKIEVVEKNGKLVFVMPDGEVSITPIFVLATDAAEQFTDLVKDSWYYDAVNFMLVKGLMAGTAADKFSPDMALTRTMIVQTLWALEGKPVVNYAMGFKDVSADAWYTEAVRWAASEGISSGYSADTFGVSDSLTREQLAVMLYAYARTTDADLTVTKDLQTYTDAASVSDWAVSAMQWACGQGLISGTPDGSLLPTGVATRAQIAVILNNFCNLING